MVLERDSPTDSESFAPLSGNDLIAIDLADDPSNVRVIVSQQGSDLLTIYNNAGTVVDTVNVRPLSGTEAVTTTLAVDPSTRTVYVGYSSTSGSTTTYGIALVTRHVNGSESYVVEPGRIPAVAQVVDLAIQGPSPVRGYRQWRVLQSDRRSVDSRLASGPWRHSGGHWARNVANESVRREPRTKQHNLPSFRFRRVALYRNRYEPGHRVYGRAKV